MPDTAKLTEIAKLKADGVTIDDANPWTAQRFVVGDEYSTCAVVADGRLLAFSDNRASLSCFNYLPARDPQLRACHPRVRGLFLVRLLQPRSEQLSVRRIRSGGNSPRLRARRTTRRAASGRWRMSGGRAAGAAG